jgi:hypothetical protein
LPVDQDRRREGGVSEKRERANRKRTSVSCPASVCNTNMVRLVVSKGKEKDKREDESREYPNRETEK